MAAIYEYRRCYCEQFCRGGRTWAADVDYESPGPVLARNVAVGDSMAYSDDNYLRTFEFSWEDWLALEKGL